MKALSKCILVGCLAAGMVVGTAGSSWGQGNIGLVWSPAMVVAGGATYDNIRPQVTLAADDVPLVIWCRSIGGHHGYVSRGNGTGFDVPVRINPTGGINAYTVEGPNIVARGDTAYLVYVTQPTTNAQVMLRSSFDAGQTWNAPVAVDSLVTDMPTFGNVEILPGGDPIVTYIRQTTAYLNPRWVVRRSMDGGQTWLPEVVASDTAPGSLVCDCCMGHTYAHEGKVIEVFRNNNNNLRDFWATISSDGGMSFPVGIDLDSTDWTLAACPSSGSASGFVGDSIYTAFMSQGSNGLARVWLGAAHLGTGQSHINFMLNGGVPSNTIQNYTTLANAGDTLVVAWMESSNGNADVLLRYSFNGVAGLWDHALVNVSEMASGTQSFPDIAYRNGQLHVVWQDDATNQVMYRSARVGVMAGMAESEMSWEISPNPAKDRLKVRGLPNWPWSLALYDAMGALLYRSPECRNGVMELDLSTVARGVYFLELNAEGAFRSTKKLVVVN